MLGATNFGELTADHDSSGVLPAEPLRERGMASALIAGAALAIATFAAPGFAQTATSPGTAAQNAGEATDTSSGALQEIVVTARKREERLIDVPVAVTAVTAATISQYQATHLSEIRNLAPGVSLERSEERRVGKECR